MRGGGDGLLGDAGSLSCDYLAFDLVVDGGSSGSEPDELLKVV